MTGPTQERCRHERRALESLALFSAEATRGELRALLSKSIPGYEPLSPDDALEVLARLTESGGGAVAGWAGRARLGARLPLLAALLKLPPQPGCPSPELDGTAPGGHRGRGGRLDQPRAAASLLLVVTDDLPWANPSTTEVLGQVLACVPRLQLLLSARDSFAPLGRTRPSPASNSARCRP